MSFLSSSACSTRMPALNVRSRTLPLLQVAQLRADERAALAGLDVLELDDLEQAVVELERDPVLQVVGADGRHGESLGEAVSTRHPVLVTTPDPPPGRRRSHHDRRQVRRSPRPPPAIRTVPCAFTNGSSWISSPTPWPVPWMNHSPKPASVMCVAADGVELAGGHDPGRTAATPARWAASTTSYTSRCSVRRLADEERTASCRCGSRRQRADVDDDGVARPRTTVDVGRWCGSGALAGPVATIVS